MFDSGIKEQSSVLIHNATPIMSKTRVMVDIKLANYKLMATDFLKRDGDGFELSTKKPSEDAQRKRRYHSEFISVFDPNIRFRLQYETTVGAFNPNPLGTVFYINGTDEMYLDMPKLKEILVQYNDKYKHRRATPTQTRKRDPTRADVDGTPDAWYLRDAPQDTQ